MVGTEVVEMELPAQPLVIRVEDVDSGEAWIYVRADSPVLLGRGEGASLRIGRPFVSQAHGVFTRDEARACWTYADLEPASATVVGGRALDAEEVVPVPPSSVLRVGTLALTVLGEPPAEAEPETASPFATGQPLAETTRLPALPAPAPPEAPAPPAPVPLDPEALPPVLSGGTLFLPEGLSPPAPAPAPRQPEAPIEPLRARSLARAIAAVAAGVTLLSALITWLLVRPTPPKHPPEPPPAVEPEATTAPAPRGPPPEWLPSPSRDEHPIAPAPHPKRRAHAAPAHKPGRGANGAYVLD